MMHKKKVFIVQGLRSPFVKAGKELAHLNPAHLAANNIKELLLKTGFKDIQEVILGHSFVRPETSNIARLASLYAGLPKEVSATTTLRNCASSMESVVTAVAKIQAGLYDCVLAGGVESMSSAPLLFKKTLAELFYKLTLSKSKKLKALMSVRFSDFKPISSLLVGLKDPITGLSMGETAELLAREFNISRPAQDEFAFLSHKKAFASENKLKAEIFPLISETQALTKDTGPKDTNPKNTSRPLTLDRLSRFSPYFDKQHGTVTIANSCPINDGSCVLMLMSQEKTQALNLKPLSFVVSSSFVGLEPERMGLGPVYSAHKALKIAGLSLKDIGLIEINEAFAAQTLACLKAFNSKTFCSTKLGLSSPLGAIDPERLNVNGGSIAIGHPIAATGARLVLTLSKEMQRRGVEFGMASLCIGGGQGGTLILKNAG